MNAGDEWLLEHKGPLIETVGEVWWCGDYDCGCRQARVTAYHRNKVDPRFRVPVGVWQGTFYTDGEGAEEAEAELDAYRASLPPDQQAGIRWSDD